MSLSQPNNLGKLIRQPQIFEKSNKFECPQVNPHLGVPQASPKVHTIDHSP